MKMKSDAGMGSIKGQKSTFHESVKVSSTNAKANRKTGKMAQGTESMKKAQYGTQK